MNSEEVTHSTLPNPRASADRENDVLAAVERIWGYTSLRPMQKQAVLAGIDRQDSLVVLPTGGGKSLCYQVPPLITGRLDIVVSPLISLMKDQVDGLRANGYPASALYSGITDGERHAIADEVRHNKIHLLFVAPERLMQFRFLNFLSEVGVTSFAIDEAHCISHWGHDFRPEYRRLAELRVRFPSASFHAFTATATVQVREDIERQLNLRNARVLVGSFDRPNLVYRMVPRVDLRSQVLEVLDRHDDEAAIVYCISRKETEQLADYLNAQGVQAKAYHAGKSPDERKRVQEAFASESLNVVVATVAFGMGIDRSNVRCVIHAAMPKSIEHFQQETGRAGRDGLPAECVLLYSQADVIRWERLIAKSALEANDPAHVIEAASVLLADIQRLASGVTCRHRALVEHFGQKFDKESCDACDVCLGELDTLSESTTISQKIISCVARVEQRFGVTHIAEVLTGSRAQNVMKHSHDTLSVHGLLSDMTKPMVVNLVHQLIDQGWLARSKGEMPIVTLSERSRDVLRNDVEVQLIKVSHKAKRPRFDHESWEGVDKGLFEELRDLRRSLGEARQVPAFVIFNDSTLRDLARKRPSSVASLPQVYGIGAKKQADLGDDVINVIRTYCDANGVSVDVNISEPTAFVRSRSTPPPKTTPSWKEDVYRFFQDGMSLADVMERTDRKENTVCKYLTDFIETNSPENIDHWIAPALYQRIYEAIKSAGLDYLRPIFDHLNGEVDFTSIKIVVAHLRATHDEDALSQISAQDSDDDFC